MAIRGGQLDCVVADLLDVGDADFALAKLQHFLARAVALHFGRWRIHAQIFKRERKGAAIVVGDVEHARFLVDSQFGRMGHETLYSGKTACDGSAQFLMMEIS